MSTGEYYNLIHFVGDCFTYDGGGKRVKSVLTTNLGTSNYDLPFDKFRPGAGSHYEVTDGVVTKYYFAGGQRIAMRSNGTLNYLIGDHLGSTSLVTDSTGNVLSQQKYKAWGETRYTSGVKLTSYGFTGQDSYEPEFGLQFFNARWYDPSLGRFAQADSIVPGGVQGLDRYAYVNNNPLRYTDPTGHESVCGQANSDPECGDLGHSPLSHPRTSGDRGSSGNNNPHPTLGDGFGLNQNADVISDLITGMPSSQGMCGLVLSGAPLLCNPNNVRSFANGFSSTAENIYSFPGPLDYPSMLFEVSNIRGWTRRAIPGVLGAAFDFTGQRMIDENMGFSPLEANVRALAVVGEGIIIDYVSLSASGLSAVDSIETGPGVAVVMISVYIGSNVTLSSGATTLNSEIFFPLIHELTN